MTGYCVGFYMDLPEIHWIGSTTFRKSFGTFSHMTGRYLLVGGRFDSLIQVKDVVVHLKRAISDHGLHPILCLSDIPPSDDEAQAIVAFIRQEGVPIVLDRFGSMEDGTRRLLQCEPDFVRFDPSLITGISDNARLRVVVANLIAMAHTLGIEVIASGIDDPRAFKICRDIGVDMVQGSAVQPPFLNGGDAVQTFAHLTLDQGGQNRCVDQRWITQQLDQIPPIEVDTPLKVVFERMARDQSANTVFPLIDRDRRPLGLLLEKTFKNLVYSTYGRDLISNRALAKSLRDFVTRCPIAETSTPLDQMLAIYSTVEDAAGILITEGGVYTGFLSAPSLIRALHERTLARAQDENPLTRLPGNSMIGDYVAGCLVHEEPVALAYVDFDYFKPFNDTYGFRQGDRAILLFAELLRALERRTGCFVGHIGGDDFFVAMPATGEPEAVAAIAGLIAEFESDAQSFYDADSRASGFIVAHDRDGNTRQFPLLSASVVVTILPQGKKVSTVDDISEAIAQHKKAAKCAPSKIVTVTLS